MLKTKFFEKKATFPVTRRFWPFFSRNIECEKPHGTNYKGPKGTLTTTVEVIRSFLWDLGGCWRQKTFGKKAIFQVKKMFWPIFSCTAEHDKRQETTFKGPQSFFCNDCGSYKIIPSGPKRMLKTKFFEKKANIPVNKRFWPSRIIKCDKPQKTIYEGPKGILTIAVEVIRSFP